MALVRAGIAAGQPLLWGAILVPCIVARERLNWRHRCVVENLIFFLNDGKGLACGLVLIDACVVLWQEGSLLYHVLVLVNNIGMASG